MTDDLEQKEIAASWDALEDAFENNAPEVHSYLHLDTGEVIRLVDGVADPALHGRIVSEPSYLRIDPVSSREQYRWMERFIATVEDAELRHKLFRAIDGKGAFRRFKDVLMTYPVDRERWFVFRSERVRACMESWLATHQIDVVERPEWNVPTADDVVGDVEARLDDAATPADSAAGKDKKVSEGTETAKKTGSSATESVAATVASTAVADGAKKDSEPLRSRLQRLCDSVPSYDLETAISFLEFLTERSFAKRDSQAKGKLLVNTSAAASTAAKPKAKAAPLVEVIRKDKSVDKGSRPPTTSLGDGVLFASQLPPDPKGGAN